MTRSNGDPDRPAVVIPMVSERATRSKTKAMASNLTDPDPEPGTELQPVHGDPPAWAKARPPLCDSLEWFRAVQGSIYHRDRTAYGFLVDADCGERVHIDDEIIIARIGGNSDKDQNGRLFLRKDQTLHDITSGSLVVSKEANIPVGVIIGDRAQALKRKLPHRYNVMGWFRITDIWFEKVTDKNGLKVRLEKMDLAEKSWWSVKGSPNPPPLDQRDFVTKPESRQCSTCSKASFRVYNEDWMCLNPSCDHFWMIDGAAPTVLTYHPTFLNYRTLPDAKMVPEYALVPHFSTTVSETYSAGSTIREAWRGIVCPDCSQCVSRVYWEGWKCTECGFEVTMKMVPLTLGQVAGPDIKRKMRPIKGLMSPQIDEHSVAPYIKRIYTLPGVGTITHFVANEAIKSSPNGPDDMFRNLQDSQLGLKRYPLSQTIVKGTMTAHFAVNYGMPYKYVVSVDSKGFDEATDDVLRALSRLSWATEKAVTSAGDVYKPPNELLILGYFEDMRIGFHDDGEESLGPTIATLSLGAKSKMLIRMKQKYYHGYGTRRGANGEDYNLLREDPVLQGCKCEDERRRLKYQYDKDVISRVDYDNARIRAFKQEKKQHGFPPVLIQMDLQHGDLVVMHGGDLQKFYEHSVIPDGKMRFALTARYIMADHVEERDREKGNFSLTPDQKYNGK